MIIPQHPRRLVLVFHHRRRCRRRCRLYFWYDDRTHNVQYGQPIDVQYSHLKLVRHASLANNPIRLFSVGGFDDRALDLPPFFFLEVSAKPAISCRLTSIF